MEIMRAYKFIIYPLSERVYYYTRCGLQMDRDVNAAINILKRATFGQSRSNAQGDSVSPQKEAGIKELRTCPAIAGKPTRFSGWEDVTFIFCIYKYDFSKKGRLF